MSYSQPGDLPAQPRAPGGCCSRKTAHPRPRPILPIPRRTKQASASVGRRAAPSAAERMPYPQTGDLPAQPRAPGGCCSQKNFAPVAPPSPPIPRRTKQASASVGRRADPSAAERMSYPPAGRSTGVAESARGVLLPEKLRTRDPAQFSPPLNPQPPTPRRTKQASASVGRRAAPANHSSTV